MVAFNSIILLFNKTFLDVCFSQIDSHISNFLMMYISPESLEKNGTIKIILFLPKRTE